MRSPSAWSGHVSPRMLEHYSHIGIEAKRRAIEALDKPEEKHTEKAKAGPRAQRVVQELVQVERLN